MQFQNKVKKLSNIFSTLSLHNSQAGYVQKWLPSKDPSCEVINSIHSKAEQHTRHLRLWAVLLRWVDVSLLQDNDCVLDMAFLNDIIWKLNHSNYKLQGKGKAVFGMTSAVNIFKVMLMFFCWWLHVLSVQTVLNVLDSASQVLESTTEWYSELDPCVLVMPNSFFFFSWMLVR